MCKVRRYLCLAIRDLSSPKLNVKRSDLRLPQYPTVRVSREIEPYVSLNQIVSDPKLNVTFSQLSFLGA